jgi:hypothetical protein
MKTFGKTVHGTVKARVQGRTAWGIQESTETAVGHLTCWRPSLKRPYGRFMGGHSHGIKGQGLVGPSDTLGSAWIPLGMRPCEGLLHGIMARGGHGLPNVSSEPAMSDPCTPCGRATPEGRFRGGSPVGWAACPFGHPTPYAHGLLYRG